MSFRALESHFLRRLEWLLKQPSSGERELGFKQVYHGQHGEAAQRPTSLKNLQRALPPANQPNLAQLRSIINFC